MSRKLLVLEHRPGWERVALSVFGWLVENHTCELWLGLVPHLDPPRLQELGRSLLEDHESRRFSRRARFVRLDSGHPSDRAAFLEAMLCAQMASVSIVGLADKYGEGQAGSGDAGRVVWLDVSEPDWWTRLSADLAATRSLDLADWFTTKKPRAIRSGSKP